MNTAMNIFQIALFALFAVAFSAWLAFAFWRGIRDAMSRIHLSRIQAFLALLAASVLVIYGGSKRGTISFLYTDPEIRYLTDAGSYVSNTYVHVAYTKLAIVPSTANLIVERRQVGQTNDADWVTHTNTTFAASPSPFDLAYPNATNWNWCVYTDWTPGPTVVTNGVWHTWWGETKTNRVIIPLRAWLRDNGTTIGTPKSRKDHEQ